MSSTKMLCSTLLSMVLSLSLAAGCTVETAEDGKGADDAGGDGAADAGGDGAADGGGDGAADGGGDGATGGDGAADGGGDGAADGGGGDAVYGPDNAWYHAPLSEVPEDRSGTGIGRGDTLGEFTLIDQNGDEVSLYQFYGKTVQLVLFAEWCGPCNAEAPEIEAASRDLADEDVQIISIMLQQNDGSAPSAEALDRWATRYDATHPLLAGGAELEAMLQGGFPTLPVLDSQMRIVNLDNFPFNAGYLRGVE